MGTRAPHRSAGLGRTRLFHPWAHEPEGVVRRRRDVSQPLTFIDRPWAGLALPTPQFYRWALGLPGPPQPLTFIDGAQASLPLAKPSLPLANLSLLLAAQTLHFYSLALAKFARAGGGPSSSSATSCALGRLGRLTNLLLTLVPPRARQVCWGMLKSAACLEIPQTVLALRGSDGLT